MSKFTDDFKDLIRIFNELEVRYLMIGGYAVVAHGHVRNTKDLDLWIDYKDDNAHKVARALEKFGISVDANEFAHPKKVLFLGVEPNRVDILTTVKGIEFEAAFAQKSSVQIDGLNILLIDKQSLIQVKRATGRPQDLLDAKALEDL